MSALPMAASGFDSADYLTFTEAGIWLRKCGTSVEKELRRVKKKQRKIQLPNFNGATCNAYFGE